MEPPGKLKAAARLGAAGQVEDVVRTKELAEDHLLARLEATPRDGRVPSSRHVNASSTSLLSRRRVPFYCCPRTPLAVLNRQGPGTALLYLPSIT